MESAAQSALILFALYPSKWFFKGLLLIMGNQRGKSCALNTYLMMQSPQLSMQS